MSAERERLRDADERRQPWRRWGPYLAERQWGTVREDYSARGTPWAYFPHEHARSRAYRWGEDGLLGICDDEGLLCFAPALWNGRDPILKERQALAGLLWSRQFYHWDIPRWLEGDAGQPAPPAERRRGRNSGWEHLNNADVLLVPDKWEYPWYAAWDLAFHCVALARVDPEADSRCRRPWPVSEGARSHARSS